MCQKDEPMVSVIMGAYNSQNYIGPAIDSILKQTYRNIEFIIIDDCSTDSTPDILKRYSQKDKRIRIVTNEFNRGLGYSLNLGVDMANGAYIARMDADDISAPKRFERQVAFLKKNTDVACVGTSARRIGNVKGLGKVFRVIHSPQSHEDIQAWLLLGTPMFHPSVMFNAQIIKKLGINYDPNFRRAQDYELWTRLVFLSKMRNIDEPLHAYRYSPKMASVVAADEQRRRARILQSHMLNKLLGRKPTEEELELHSKFVFQSELGQSEIKEIDSWLNYCISMSKANGLFNTNSLKKVFATRRAVIIRNNLASRITRIRQYYMEANLSLLNMRTVMNILR